MSLNLLFRSCCNKSRCSGILTICRSIRSFSMKKFALLLALMLYSCVPPLLLVLGQGSSSGG